MFWFMEHDQSLFFLYLVILRVKLVRLVNWLNTALIENQENQQQLLNAHFENSLWRGLMLECDVGVMMVVVVVLECDV